MTAGRRVTTARVSEGVLKITSLKLRDPTIAHDVHLATPPCSPYTEESGGIKSYDGGKQVKGRKRHVLVDTFGLLLSVTVTPANTSDQVGARRLLIGLKPLQPRLELIWADGSYSGEPLATWCAAEGAWRLEIITPTPHVKGCVVRPWCWIVERTLGRLGRQRRPSKDYERKVQTSETLLKLAMIRLMLRRSARSSA